MAGYLYRRWRSSSWFSSAVSASLKLSETSRKRMFSVGTKPSKKMLMPVKRTRTVEKKNSVGRGASYVRRVGARQQSAAAGGPGPRATASQERRRTFADAEGQRHHTVGAGHAVQHADEVGQVVEHAQVVLDSDDVPGRIQRWRASCRCLNPLR